MMNGFANKEECNKGGYSIFSDSYIEWRFECECKKLNNGDQIFIEWCKQKQQFVSMLSTIAFDFQHYSMHDASHSVCIIQRIEQILGKERVDLLSAGDLWLILQVAYSHDIGMALTHDELVDLWENNDDFKEYVERCLDDDMGDLHKAALFLCEADNLIHKKNQMSDLEGKEAIDFEDDWPIVCSYYLNILVSEYVRKHHAFRSRNKYDVLDSVKKVVIPDRLYDVAAKVNAMHGRNFEDILTDLKYRIEGFGKEKIHPQFVAVMLRLGDLLDIDNNRFDPYLIEHFGRLPALSLLHSKKHKAVTHICISEDEISAEAETDEYEVAVISDNWFKYIDKEVENLICYWNQIVPKNLSGCKMKMSVCKTYLNNQLFDSSKKHEFSVNKEKLIDLMIGTSIYQTKMECVREYLQNAIDASKIQLWMDLQNGRYDSISLKNDEIFDNSQLTPFDLDKRVYQNYEIKIYVEWNENKNKIRIKFKDNGIGIERDYMEKLSVIGTRWHGRPQYQSMIKKMVKWLQPTGGFGIGLQSAFMVSNSVEIITKSEEEAYGYKINLSTQEKNGGTVAITQMDEKILRGTTVSYEISPDKFQAWMRWLAKQEENEVYYLGEQDDYEYKSSDWDEFDENGILKYVTEFMENYIASLAPNSLFPIVIKSPITKERVLEGIEWPEVNYWMDSSKYIEEQYRGKEFIGLEISKKDKEDPKFLIWNKTDNIYMKIKMYKSMDKVCYKNIVVRDCDKSKLDLFSQYSICVDFMGIHVKDCIHLHRNSFLEDFKYDVYVKECFGIYLLYLKKNYNHFSEDDLEFSRWDEKWDSYYIQLIRTIEYSDIEANGVKIKERPLGIKRLVKSGNGQVDIIEKDESTSKVMKIIQDFYQYLNDVSNDDGDNISHYLLINDFNLKEIIRLPDVRLKRTTLENFMYNSEENIGLRDSKRFMLLKTLADKGLIMDYETIKILKSDERLNLIAFACHEMGLRGYALEFKKSVKTISENEIISELWNDKVQHRIMLRVDHVSKYKELLVRELPFSRDIKNGVFIISPLSKAAIENVQNEMDKGIAISYENFRKLVWGEKGKESSSYKMMIDWVEEKQINSGYYRGAEIRDCYEKLLKDIYKRHVYKAGKRRK